MSENPRPAPNSDPSRQRVGRSDRLPFVLAPEGAREVEQAQIA